RALSQRAPRRRTMFLFLRRLLLLASSVLLLGGPARGEPPPKPGEHPDQARALTDLYGDPLPKGALARLGTVRWRLGEAGNAIALAPDGKTVVAAGAGMLRFWDAVTGKELRRLDVKEDAILDVVFSPDGKTLAVLGWKDQFRLLDAESGRELRVVTA